MCRHIFPLLGIDFGHFQFQKYICSSCSSSIKTCQDLQQREENFKFKCQKLDWTKYFLFRITAEAYRGNSWSNLCLLQKERKKTLISLLMLYLYVFALGKKCSVIHKLNWFKQTVLLKNNCLDTVLAWNYTENRINVKNKADPRKSFNIAC